jgi:hypothetical protein
MTEQMKTESEGFQRFLSDMEQWQRREWYSSRLFQKLEKRLREKRRKKYGGQ